MRRTDVRGFESPEGDVIVGPPGTWRAMIADGVAEIDAPGRMRLTETATAAVEAILTQVGLRRGSSVRTVDPEIADFERRAAALHDGEDAPGRRVTTAETVHAGVAGLSDDITHRSRRSAEGTEKEEAMDSWDDMNFRRPGDPSPVVPASVKALRIGAARGVGLGTVLSERPDLMSAAMVEPEPNFKFAFDTISLRATLMCAEQPSLTLSDAHRRILDADPALASRYAREAVAGTPENDAWRIELRNRQGAAEPPPEQPATEEIIGLARGLSLRRQITLSEAQAVVLKQNPRLAARYRAEVVKGLVE